MSNEPSPSEQIPADLLAPPDVDEEPVAEAEPPKKVERKPTEYQAAIAAVRDQMIQEASDIARSGKTGGPHEQMKAMNRWFRLGWDAARK